MAIPPFPSQDLAKLVLGYLAEEQLMTAYDEFLQASPYLDAMHNEYDRIFMTSLKSILAEYRAVKIYVETCKPFLLRKKLFQCTNLLEMVKFLITYIDVNKLQMTEDQLSSDKLCTTNLLKYSACEVCNSLKFSNCVCKTKQNQQKNTNSASVIYQDETSMVNSVETTSLADLPGSHIKNKKKAVKVLDKGCKVIQSYNNCITSEQSSTQSSGVTSNHDDCNSNEQTVQNIQQPFQINLNLDTTMVDENKGVATVCNKIAVRDKKPKKPKRTTKKGSTPTSFQDFAFGVRGGENQKGLEPVSITSETTNAQSSLNNKQCESVSGIPKSQLYLKIEPARNNSTQDNEVMNTVNSYPFTKIRPMDPKVKILSDVKVDNAYKSNDRKKKAITNNATSTPMMKMQTLVINGTPAYRTQIVQSNQTFSRDEIMAMPTIIVVPSSGSQPVISQPQPVTSVTASTTTTQVNTTNKNLSPLIIDISSPTSDGNGCEPNFTKETAKNVNDVGLVKTVDTVTHLQNSSLPKDTVTSLEETSTPHMIPVTRKSSSTPRRTSHIRVLDFTTPRRILHETINEQAPNENHNSPLEVVSVENCNTEICTVSEEIIVNNTKKQGENTDDIIFDKQENKSRKKQSNNNGDMVSDKLKESTEKHKFPIKASWDSKLRSLITPNDGPYNIMASTSTTSNRISNNTNNTKDKATTKSRKPKKIKHKQVIDDDEPEQIKKTEVVQTIKPTINIKCGNDRSIPSTFVDKKDSKVNQDKVMEEEHINTPEGERLTLQNVMCAKLNISELLETPYKQALYDIQMETPRCLVPDLPGEPLSDFKIMSIPTPRFFDSPKITSATPSYSSRPTDYSSGGSYYKPDDQDFIPSDLNCMVSATNEDTKAETIEDNSSNIKKNSRPVRKCAKNVSYYNSFRAKDLEDIINTALPCNESTNTKSVDSKCEKENLNASKDKSSDTNESKPEKKKSSRKQKSLVSKDKKSKTFMKIKPRRVTPIKDTLSGRIRKKTMQSTPAKAQSKRTTSKEKKISVTPTLSCVPTKSRRKSSTPRKLHCSKTLNPSSGNEAADVNKKPNIIQETNSASPQESDVNQLALRWSDDGSQELKRLEEQTTNDSEDISKIKEYIEKTVMKPLKENEGVFRNDLIKRGFDIETARIIERDLLDTPPQNDTNQTVVELPIKLVGTNNAVESSFETVSAIQIDDDSDEIEFSLHECNDETNNFVVFEYNDTKETITRSSLKDHTLKDKFSMEVCIDDDLTIRLRATPFIQLYDFDENNEDKECNAKETEEAVKSILNMDSLYTPLKASVKEQVYNIFDSTLTSLDTPLKDNSPKMMVSEVSVNDGVLEEEETANNEKVALQKRKRYQSDGSEESLKDNKRAKPDAQYLLSSANIQNIDIETVLKKLHGP